jgi:ubiquinone/menaquinone biosynthesis C-methylase UbiE
MKPDVATDRQAHWDNVYRTKRPTEVSWYQENPALSLEFIERAVADRSAPIIDVGGGASTLVDRLLQSGYSDVTVLDVSQAALDEARARLGDAGSRVRWIAGDALTAPLPDATFALWHDRAVFHFLTDGKDRVAYVGQVRRALRPKGCAVVATFADDGPTRCSGLPVARYSAEALRAEFGPAFQLVDSAREQHVTPAGVTQSFVYCLMRIGDVRL